MERLTIPDVRVDEHTTRKTIIDARAVREHAMDFYWRLKAYEDTELDPAVCADYKTFEDEAISKGRDIQAHYRTDGGRQSWSTGGVAVQGG